MRNAIDHFEEDVATEVVDAKNSRASAGAFAGKCIVESFSFPHIEDGALFSQTGQRFLCAGSEVM